MKMAKLVKKYFYTSKGEQKINNYLCVISKNVANEAGFTGDENIKVTAKKDKIVIEKEV